MSELTERQKFILGLVVHEYIRTVVPVGSKHLVTHYHLGCSSATVRNELAQLTEMGLLHQPHTSAGRVPTEEGYRVFVSRLMQTQELPTETRRMIEHQFSQAQKGMDGWMKLAASVLAAQAGAIALVSSPMPLHNSLKHIALISITGKQVLMVLIFAGGQMQQRFLYLPHPTTQSRLDDISEKINRLFPEKNGEEICAAIEENLVSDPVTDEIFRNLQSVLYDTDTIGSGEVYTDGINNVLAEPEFAASEEARRNLRVLYEKALIGDFLTRSTREQAVGGLQVFIGGDGALKKMKNCSLIVARYGMQGVVTGTIGVLGPMRMAYSRNIPMVHFLAGLLSDLVADTNGEFC